MMNSGITRDASWRQVKLPVLIRSFQQHKLKGSLTEVHIRRSFRVMGYEQANGAAAAQIRSCLLDHHPCRVSGRGEGN
jgi:hypothetical protein